MNKYRDIVDKLKDDIQVMKNGSRNIYIVNAGRMNHGKSSLFNSLSDSESFKVGDIRVTTKRQDVQFVGDAYLVDTPGLDANTDDDTVALSVYKKANMIIFVHTPNIGEFHKDEIDNINKIAELFPSKEYFWKHFCLVLTSKESVSAEDLENIKNKIVTDIEMHCGGKNYPIFEVSNIRYQKGKKENKQALVKNSGIEELQNFLKDNIAKWKNDNEKLLSARIQDKIDEVRKSLELERKRVNSKLQRKKIENDKEKRRLDSLIGYYCDDIIRCIDERDEKYDEVCLCKSELNQLKERHEREKANY